MNPNFVLFDLHLYCLIWMTSAIWLVQLIIYPAFRKIPDELFPAYHREHTAKITPVVAPPMILQLVISVIWVMQSSDQNLLPWIGLGFILLIFLATILLSVPEHSILKNQKDLASIDRLIQRNWIRTTLWTLETIIFILKKGSE